MNVGDKVNYVGGDDGSIADCNPSVVFTIVKISEPSLIEEAEERLILLSDGWLVLMSELRLYKVNHPARVN